MIEKQRVIIDELKEKINLPLDNLDKLSNDELKRVVDNAMFQVDHAFIFSSLILNRSSYIY